LIALVVLAMLTAPRILRAPMARLAGLGGGLGAGVLVGQVGADRGVERFAVQAFEDPPDGRA
jgi:hypothetical protein